MSTDAIDVDVEVTATPTHDRVTVRLRNRHAGAIAVRLEQPYVPGVAPSQVAVDAAYDTGPWEDGESLVFIEKVPAGKSVETAYAVGGADTSTVRDLLRAVTVEVRGMDGTPLGREGAGTRRASDLPASVSDYVLRDVNDVAAEEFDWTPVEEESKGLLRQFIPFL